jgi:hypothetical protein
MLESGASAAPLLPNSRPETSKRHPEASSGPGRAAGVVPHAQTTASLPRFRAQKQARGDLAVPWGELRKKATPASGQMLLAAALSGFSSLGASRIEPVCLHPLSNSAERVRHAGGRGSTVRLTSALSAYGRTPLTHRVPRVGRLA